MAEALRCIRLLAAAVLIGLAASALGAGPGGELAGKGLLHDRAELRWPAAALRGRARQNLRTFCREGRPVLELHLQILEFEQVRETAFRPWAEGTVPRRFCSAVAMVSDGLKHRVNYWIGEDTGMIGMTWGVEWCVVGLDRNWAYNPACKMARP